MKKRIVIIGIGNVGFSLLKELYRSNNLLEIVAIDRVFPKHLKEFIEKNNAQNEIHFIQSDVTDELNFRQVSNDSRLAIVNVLICTVGILSSATDFQNYRKEFHINLFGNITPIRALLDKIPRKSNSRIIILSSISGNIAPTDKHSYAPSKWALENFSSSLREEYFDEGIYIDIIRPFNIVNKYSDAFKIDRGVTPESVARRIMKQVKLSLNDHSASGKNCFVPRHLFLYRFVERIFPEILNVYFGLKMKFQRKKIYKKLKIDTAIITDVNSHLGKQLAYLYANKAKELIICSNEEDSLNDIKDKLGEVSSCKVTPKKLNMYSAEAVSGLLKTIEGHVDLLINTSSRYFAKPVEDTTTTEYVEMMDANFLIPATLIQNLILNKGMHKVINVLPEDAIYGTMNHSAYSGSKAALWAYLKSMRRQKGNSIHFLEVFLNTITIKPKNSAEMEKIAHRIFKADRKGKDTLMISNTIRWSLLLQNFAYPLFKKIKLNR